MMEAQLLLSPLASFEGSWQFLLLGLLGAFSLGIAKAGFPGLSLVNVMIMAELFEAKNSVGIVLPLLIACDLIVYPLFRKHGSWREVLPLLFPTLVGVALGFFFMGRVDNEVLRPVIGGIILLMLALQWLRKRHANFLAEFPDSKMFRQGSGLSMGVATMMANAAGPLYSIYALVRGMRKELFLGIGARFFLLVNCLKVPLGMQLGIINKTSLLIDAWLLPGAVAGIFVGKQVLGLVNQELFEKLLFFFALLAALRLLFF